MDNPAHGSETSVPTRLGPLRVHTVGTGAPALLWHSLFVDSSTWRRVRQPLADARRLLLVDGPGHGHSTAPSRPFTLGDCADAAIDVLDHFGAHEPVDWVGNAWGGHVGIAFAAAYPDRCRSLATIGTPVHALPAHERRQISLLSRLYRLAGPVRPVVKPLTNALLGPHATATDPEATALVADAFRRADRRGMYLAIQSASLNRSDLTPTLATVGAPALFAAGSEDPTWTPAHAAAAVARLPHGASTVLAGAGHVAPLLEAAPAVVDLLTTFWEDPAVMVAAISGATAPSAPRLR